VALSKVREPILRTFLLAERNLLIATVDPGGETVGNAKQTVVTGTKIFYREWQFGVTICAL
jgi:hypothetical protein